MSYTVIDCEQKSPEWYAARAGRLTGSVAADIMKEGRSKGSESIARRDLRLRLALERITGRPQEEEFTTAALRHGIEKEPVALGMYEALTGQIVERTGFLSLGPVMAGCSLDGFVSNREGIVEVKCPKSATHLEYIQTRRVPTDYYWQCVHNLWVSGAKWCDYMSFDDRFPAELQFLRIRIERDPITLQAWAGHASKFLAEVNVLVGDIKKLKVAA